MTLLLGMLISGYEQNGKPKDALALFNKLQHLDVKPDQGSLVSTLLSCAKLSALETGCWIHAFIRKNNFTLNFHLSVESFRRQSKYLNVCI